MSRIDAFARVDAKARIADDVEIGPFTVIGPDVEIGAGCRVGPHVVIHGYTTIGRNNRIYQFACVGEEPQHLGYKGEPTRVEIGDGNSIREYCSIHRGTAFDRGVTRIGNNNLLMAYVHIAHDSVLGDHIIMANGASLAGHVQIGDRCLFGGFALVHQFVRVGRLAFLGYSTGVAKDVPPYFRCADHVARPYGVNSIGMRRAGRGEAEVAEAKRLYKLIYRSGLRLVEARQRLVEQASTGKPMVAEMLAFLESSKRGIIR